MSILVMRMRKNLLRSDYLDWSNRIRAAFGLSPIVELEDDISWVNLILIKDLERCPYVPKDLEYEEWNRSNDLRLKQIAISRGWKPLVRNQDQEEEK